MSPDEFRALGKQLADHAALMEQPCMKWQSISSAPTDGTEIVLLLESGVVVRASYRALDSDVNAWVAADDQPYPDDWTDAACWKSNADEEPSDQPVQWMSLPPAPVPGQDTP